MNTHDKIKNMVESQKIFLFMKGTPEAPQCGFSAQVVQVLAGLQVRYGSFDVLADEEIRAGIKEYGNWPTIPQVYVDGKLVGGCDIVLNLAQTGELQKLLSDSSQ